jgi:hypothetical protein
MEGPRPQIEENVVLFDDTASTDCDAPRNSVMQRTLSAALNSRDAAKKERRKPRQRVVAGVNRRTNTRGREPRSIQLFIRSFHRVLTLLLKDHSSLAAGLVADQDRFGTRRICSLGYVP